MITRRFLLLAGAAAGSLGAVSAPALAAPRRGHPAAKGKAQAEQIPTSPAQTPLGPIDVMSRWACIQDFNTGAVLLDKDCDVPMPPSSMTKMMTLYIVYSRLKAGRMSLDDQLPVSEKAWRTGGSKMFVPMGGTVRVEDLIRGIEVDSGNDACIVLAEAISGSEEAFVELMNKDAKQLGLTNSHFQNCTGLPDPDHHMSARDIATLARVIISQFPKYYHYASEKTFKYNNIEQYNRNPLVQKGMADGLKTGHTDAGGYGVCASAERGGRRVIVVVNGLPTSRARSEESERLMEWSFREFENVTLFTAGDTIENAKVWLGAQQTVPLVGGKDLVVTMPRSWRKTAKVTIDYDAPVRAPVARGAELGKLTISGQGVPNMQVPLYAGADVPRLSLPGRALAVLTHYVTGG